MRKTVFVACLGLLVVTRAFSQEIMYAALQRSGTGVSFTGDTNTHTVFRSNPLTVVSGAGVVKDTVIQADNLNGPACAYNYGATASRSGWRGIEPFLIHFDLAQTPWLKGSDATNRVIRAEFRFHLNNDLNGNPLGGSFPGIWPMDPRNGGPRGPWDGSKLGRIVYHDWAEGTRNGTFPNGVPGATFWHPNAVNAVLNWGYLNNDRDWGSAGTNSHMLFNDYHPTDNPEPDVMDYRIEKARSGNWVVYDVTDLVETWAESKPHLPNYGFCVRVGTDGIDLSEIGQLFQPVLFIEYEPFYAFEGTYIFIK